MGGIGSGPYEIVCDEEKQEVNVVRVYPEPGILVYTAGKDPRRYAEYTEAQLGRARYFLSRSYFVSDDCDRTVDGTCGISTYTLFECNLDFTDCNPIPIEYTTSHPYALVFETNELASELNLYQEHCVNEDCTREEKVLIFTYGEKSRCYVDGCTILAE
jgi:hypothetical protein